MGFWAHFFDYAVSLFAFGALILEFFALIANTYNVPFLKDIYFTRLSQNTTTSPVDFIDFGLWNYCNGTNNIVTACSIPKAAFVWTNATSFQKYIPGGLDGYNEIFLANFVLYWCGLALTLFVFIFSLFSHLNRVTDFTVATFATATFVVLLAVFCISIVVSTRIILTANASGGGTVIGKLGPATWIILGAMIGLLLAMIYYCIGCFFRTKKSRSYGRV